MAIKVTLLVRKSPWQMASNQRCRFMGSMRKRSSGELSLEYKPLAESNALGLHLMHAQYFCLKRVPSSKAPDFGFPDVSRRRLAALAHLALVQPQADLVDRCDVFGLAGNGEYQGAVMDIAWQEIVFICYVYRLPTIPRGTLVNPAFKWSSS